jgi:hypothetical protein
MANRPRDFDLINKQIQLARVQSVAIAALARDMIPNPPGMVNPKDVERFSMERLRQLRGGR